MTRPTPEELAAEVLPCLVWDPDEDRPRCDWRGDASNSAAWCEHCRARDGVAAAVAADREALRAEFRAAVERGRMQSHSGLQSACDAILREAGLEP